MLRLDLSQNCTVWVETVSWEQMFLKLELTPECLQIAMAARPRPQAWGVVGKPPPASSEGKQEPIEGLGGLENEDL